MCALWKIFQVSGTGLRRHTKFSNCLAAPELQPLEPDGFEEGSYTLGLQKLRCLSSYLLLQHGFADPDMTRVALATVKYLHVNSAFPQWQNVRRCQLDAEKLVVVEQKDQVYIYFFLGLGFRVWVAYPKETVLEDLQREIAGILRGLLNAEKLPKKHSDELARFAEYGLRTGKPYSYAAIFVRQQPELHNQRLKTLEDILTLLQDFLWCAHHFLCGFSAQNSCLEWPNELLNVLNSMSLDESHQMLLDYRLWCIASQAAESRCMHT